ncbi:hypothetical protein [Methylomonas sp. UP202]|uniref:hypothetical protein n=1 Tax=Methylomonas sp. UP202 TaxID=3040943 RepID=UPI002478D7DA|nr:hypothetical protein [Methylomonas sp. UP202]WGS85423.1 hypothetical protein QC632_20670 [Methylomonas sp. UP202]
MKLSLILATLALTTATAGSYASSVTVTANFTQFTMGGFASAAATFNNQLSVNGTPIDVCGGDPTCASAINNPSSITVALSGNSVSFGYDQNRFPTARMNEFSFSGSPMEVAGLGPENSFKLGSITYTNGMFYSLAFLDFTLTTHSNDAALDNHMFNGRIRLDTNQSLTFPADPMVEADYFTVGQPGGGTFTTMGSVRVYDYGYCPDGIGPNCNTGSVDLIGHINSLDLDKFANPAGGAFLNASITSTLTPVPIPPAGILLGSSLFGLSRIRKSRTRI